MECYIFTRYRHQKNCLSDDVIAATKVARRRDYVSSAEIRDSSGPIKALSSLEIIDSVLH